MDKTSSALARVGHWLRPGLRCSFCGRRAADVERLVAGASAYICGTCVSRCVAVLEQHAAAAPGPGR